MCIRDRGKAPAAHKGMVHAAKIMAATAVDVISDETLLARAKKDHQERVTQTPYVCPCLLYTSRWV